jgi:DNA-binding transcriptional ArsR family regulator
LAKSDMSCDCEVIHSDVVEYVKANLPSGEMILDLSGFFKVLGNGTRARIISALNISEMCVCDLAVLLDMTKSAISHQLRVLKKANLVKNRKDGKIVFYSLSDDHVKAIFDKGLEHVVEAVG